MTPRDLTREPPCVLCEVRRDNGDPIPHKHDNGTPQTPCKPCWEMRHTECQPDPYWCGCSHPVCCAFRL